MHGPRWYHGLEGGSGLSPMHQVGTGGEMAVFAGRSGRCGGCGGTGHPAAQKKEKCLEVIYLLECCRAIYRLSSGWDRSRLYTCIPVLGICIFVAIRCDQ